MFNSLMKIHLCMLTSKFLNGKYLAIFITLICINVVHAQEQALEYDYQRLHTPNILIKLPSIPFAWVAIRHKSIWMTLQYEKRFSYDNNFTLNHVIDYHNWDFTMVVNGVLVSRVPNNIEFFYRPQIRYYFGKDAFRGFFFGLYPVYMYRDLKYRVLRGNYIGGGAIGGYQFFIKDRISIEANSWLSFQRAYAHKVDIQGQPYREHDTFGWLSFELSIGLPIRSKR